MVTNSVPEKFKIKIPENYSKELSLMYDFLFDELGAGWCGCFHYIWNDSDPSLVAPNQDGYLYVWKDYHFWKLSADSSYFKDQEIIEYILDYSIDNDHNKD